MERMEKNTKISITKKVVRSFTTSNCYGASGTNIPNNVNTTVPCDTCGGPGGKNCSRCKRGSYCDDECFRKNYKHHRKTCHENEKSETELKKLLKSVDDIDIAIDSEGATRKTSKTSKTRKQQAKDLKRKERIAKEEAKLHQVKAKLHQAEALDQQAEAIEQQAKELKRKARIANEEAKQLNTEDEKLEREARIADEEAEKLERELDRTDRELGETESVGHPMMEDLTKTGEDTGETRTPPSNDKKSSSRRRVRGACGRQECGNKGRHRCSRCRAVSYCCQDCLNISWATHQPLCDKVVKEQEQDNNSDEMD